MKEPIKFTGERAIWWDPSDHLREFKTCLDFYLEAMDHARGKRVIDAACGTGFGTFLLSTVAEEVFGIDVNAEIFAESEARLPFRCPTKFLELDLEKSPVDITADLCVSIETIEHLENPDFFLSNLKAKELFFTVPCYGNKNEFHKIEYNEEKCAELIRRHFPILTYTMPGRRMVGHAKKPQILP